LRAAILFPRWTSSLGQNSWLFRHGWWETRAMADLADQIEDSIDRLYEAGVGDLDAMINSIVQWKS
jgi:hypothetical protein